MIEREVAPCDPEVAARRAVAAGGAFWLQGPDADDEGQVGQDIVGALPVDSVVCDAATAAGPGAGLATVEEAWQRAQRAWADAPPGVPVAVGYLGYDLGRAFEVLPSRAVTDHGFADLCWRFHDAVWLRDARTGRCRILAVDDAAARRCQQWLAAGGDGGAAAPRSPVPRRLEPDAPDGSHRDAVRDIRELIGNGEVYQVNLARRLSTAWPGGVTGRAEVVRLAERLRRSAPAPFGFLLCDVAGTDDRNPAADVAGRALVGNSPELFLRLGSVRDGERTLETRPIKGTRPRGATPDEDRRSFRALLASPKDAAEHVMIVDLERNDLGRVCRSGSVGVDGVRRVVSLPTVHHLVSTVRGVAPATVGLETLLRATFPGGSITGAPKIRAMQVIESLEPWRRGPYTGATGWLGAAGDAELSVAIRTAAVAGGRLRLWVGGGIVWDSDADAELEETRVKAEAFARVL